MKTIVKAIAIGAILSGASGCQVKKTQEGKLPKVEVKTSEGQLPAYNVQGPDVKVGSKTEEVKVPTIRVTTPAHKG